MSFLSPEAPKANQNSEGFRISAGTRLKVAKRLFEYTVAIGIFSALSSLGILGYAKDRVVDASVQARAGVAGLNYLAASKLFEQAVWMDPDTRIPSRMTINRPDNAPILAPEDPSEDVSTGFQPAPSR